MKRVRLTGGMSVVFLFRSELAVGRCSLDERLMSLGVISSARSKPRAICVNGREALDCKSRQQTSRAGFRVWLAIHAGLSAHMTVVTQAGCESVLFVYYFLKSSRTWKGSEKKNYWAKLGHFACKFMTEENVYFRDNGADDTFQSAKSFLSASNRWRRTDMSKQEKRKLSFIPIIRQTVSE